MAELPENADTNQATEAKLCAYLEGELSPADRAEIEQYLNNYPQHRQLLKELGATRRILQGLPRESAPGEVAEAFKGHMERAMLLDDAHDGDPIVRINHRPQMALAAAIVLLAAGLGVFVYKILPRPIQNYSIAPATTQPLTVAIATPAHTVETKKTPDYTEIAAAPSAPAAPGSSAAPAGISTATTPPAAVASAEATRSEILDGKAQPQKDSFAFAGDTTANTSVSTGIKSPAADRSRFLLLDSIGGPMDKATSDRLEKSGLIANPAATVCLVVRSDDPVLAHKQVRTYFATNKIPFDVLDESKRLQLDEDERRTGSENGVVGGGGFGGGGGGGRGENLSTAANQPLNFKILPSQAQKKAAEPATQPDVSAKRDLAKSENSALNAENQADHEVQGLQNGNNQASSKQNANDQAKNLGEQSNNGQQSNLGAQSNVGTQSNTGTFQYAQNATALNTDKQGAATQPTVAQQLVQQEKLKSDDIAPILPPVTTGSLSDGSDAATSPLFVARAMTRQEAARMSVALSTEQMGQTADFYPATDPRGNGATFFDMPPATRPAIAFGATTQPTTAPAPAEANRDIAPGDRLTVTVAQLVGPGVDKTNTVQVADNGTISLPMIEPVPVAGESTDAVSKRIAAKYHEANLIDEATVTVSPAATTQPAGIAEAPATQPADNQTLDVVVVVEKNSSAMQLEPTTQPTVAAPDATPAPVK